MKKKHESDPPWEHDVRWLVDSLREYLPKGMCVHYTKWPDTIEVHYTDITVTYQLSKGFDSLTRDAILTKMLVPAGIERPKRMEPS